MRNYGFKRDELEIFRLRLEFSRVVKTTTF